MEVAAGQRVQHQQVCEVGYSSLPPIFSEGTVVNIDSRHIRQKVFGEEWYSVEEDQLLALGQSGSSDPVNLLEKLVEQLR